MRKKITLTLAILLGMTGTVFAAANPFDDVPTKHWAYDSVVKLSQAGIIDGYGDKAFRGDKTLTRYEMAQIVGKAISNMSKMNKVDVATRAEVDKLSKEFSDELKNLGVRMDKVEAKQSNVKLTADLRVRWNNTEDKSGAAQWKDRYRLNMTAQINDNTSFYGRYVFQDDKFNQDSGQRLSDMAFTTKGIIDNTSVTLGRYSLNMGPTTYLSGTTGDLDGIVTNTTVGGFGLMLGYAQVRQQTNTVNIGGTTYNLNTNGNTLVTNGLLIKNIEFAEATYAMGKAKFYGDFLKNLNAGKSDGNGGIVQDAYNITGGGVTYKFASDWKFVSEYYKNTASAAKLNGNSPTATIIHVDYKGASAAVPGSWGISGEYTKFEGNVIPYQFSGPFQRCNPADLGITAATGGVKMYGVEYDYALAKNITFNVLRQFNIKNTVTGADAPYGSYTRAQINYYF